MQTPDLGSGWNPRLKSALERLIAEYRVEPSDFDPPDAPVAVFDFDNTTVFGDFGEQVFRHQVDRLVFGMTPEHFAKRMPDNPRGITHVAEKFGGAAINDLAADIADAYAVLHGAYEGLGGGSSLEETRRLPEYPEFRAKFNLLFDALIETPGIGKIYAYPWSIQIFAGMTRRRLHELSHSVWEHELRAPIGVIDLESPANLKSRSGVQRTRVLSGIRVVDETARLYRALRAAGFHVYIVTASFQEIITPLAYEFEHPYFVGRDRVCGTRLMPAEHIDNGPPVDDAAEATPVAGPDDEWTFTDELDTRHGYAVTYGPGKVQVIDSVIGRAPVLVAGDSDTDFEMLVEYPETRVRLLIDRGSRGSVMDDLFARADKGEASYFRQTRDEKKGTFLP
ncbi:MAG: hypothetical protein H6685_04490 [Deltaproteobacteria bacterium]|nr:hypothetical protein [Deltaproteobacteria bacterium]